MLLLLPWLLEAVEAESWGCCAEPGASLSALGREPRSLLVRGVGLNCEFLELHAWRRVVEDRLNGKRKRAFSRNRKRN